MCRNIRTLFNFEPPATELEIRDAALQFVRKLSGMNVPSQANAAVFDAAVVEVAESARRLIRQLHTQSPPRDRATARPWPRRRASAAGGALHPPDAEERTAP